MKVTNIILAKRWRNFKTGQTASLYGAVPYCSEQEKKEWHIEVIGYTWKLSDGTIGLGRVPAKTMEEAREVMNRVNG